MAILTFNYYFNGSPSVDDKWRGFYEAQSVWGKWNGTYEALVYIPPYKHCSFSPVKIQVIADNYTEAGITASSTWYIDVKNPFAVIASTGKVTSPTAYLDCIRVEKLNPLHYRDQPLRLYFYMTDNFVTDLDNANYFEVTDNTVLSYYSQLVNVYYPQTT